MSFSAIANAEQLNVLSQAFNQHCRERGITDTDEREHIALLAVTLYFSGKTSLEELLAGLEVTTGDDDGRNSTQWLTRPAIAGSPRSGR
jgi:hypothetical protein